MSQIFYIHSSVDEHLVWFHFWAIVNEEAMSIDEQVAL